MSVPHTLGSYPVEAELGRGGMGVVYLARDPRLGRQVAIKVLPDRVATDPETLARFDREAKLLASLNHPNIAAIYGIEAAGAQQLLILEFVPGDTLAARISQGALPLDEALDVARQIALAIEAAHDGGIVHRDLKPGNVKVTPDGRVKVLDFGLAKGSGPAVSSGDLAHSPTMTYSPTGVGVILGTAGYMSPEQARGKVVDRRTDIWSFGCVLFECLTGRQTFEGETVSDTIAKILEREPDWSRLPANTPVRIRELLHRCLERDPKKRQRDMGDARLEIEAVIEGRSSAARSSSGTTSTPTAVRVPRRTAAAVAASLVVGAALGIGGWTWFAGGRGAAGAVDGPVRVSLTIPPTLRIGTLRISWNGRLVIGTAAHKRPDGTDEARPQIFVRSLDDYNFRFIPGTDGARTPVQSRDGRWLAFIQSVSDQSSAERLMKVPVDGSTPPVALADWDDSWSTLAAWLDNGDLIVMTDSGTKFLRVPTSGDPAKSPIKIDAGQATVYGTIDGRLPGDDAAFITTDAWGPKGYQEELWLLDLVTGKASKLLDQAGDGIYTAGGYLLFTRDGALMAAPFDARKRSVTGESKAIFAGLRTGGAGDNGGFDLADNGTLMFLRGGQLGADRRLITVAPNGVVTPYADVRRNFVNQIAMSADGRRIAVVTPTPKGTFEVWVADAGRPDLHRVAALPNADCTGPVWSPDGQRLAYIRNGLDADDGVYVRRADGSDTPHRILATDSKDTVQSPNAWTPDGAMVIVTREGKGKAAMFAIPVALDGSAGTAVPWHPTTGNDGGLRFSPDGKLAAFISDETGNRQIYVARFQAGRLASAVALPEPQTGRFAWAADSRHLLYVKPPYAIMSVAVDTTRDLVLSAPVAAFDLKALRVNPTQWDLLPGGSLLGVQRSEGEDEPTAYDLVLNWFDELKSKIGKQ